MARRNCRSDCSSAIRALDKLCRKLGLEKIKREQELQTQISTLLLKDISFRGKGPFTLEISMGKKKDRKKKERGKKRKRKRRQSATAGY